MKGVAHWAWGAVVGGLFLTGAQVDAQAPDTDVWLAPLSRVGDSLVVGTPKNVTRRAGYDNQPSFTPDAKAILYTAVVDGQAEIFRYELRTGAITRLTNTVESEYSPTVTPDGKWFSVVRVEKDSTQRLWKFPLAGGEPVLVLPNVKPVGYHAWIDDTTLVLYVLGQPARLQSANPRSGEVELFDEGIGRGLAPSPNGRSVSYVQRDGVRATIVEQRLDRPLRQNVRTIYSLVAMPRSTTDFFAWTPGGELFAASGTSLLRWNARRDSTSAWVPLAELSASVLHNVTRLAVSPDGRWLAFVAEPAAPPVTKER
jgi:hypothetical protein